MLVQAGRKWRVPLAGRPLVLAIRFTTRATDATSDWAKVPIDQLLPGRLGLLVDDSPRYAEIVTWCEYAPRDRGFVLLEVWSGEEPKKRKPLRRKA
jgi:hypothetical protein